MGKLSQLDKAIAQLEREIEVLQYAMAKLQQQKTTAAKAKPASTEVKA